MWVLIRPWKIDGNQVLRVGGGKLQEMKSEKPEKQASIRISKAVSATFSSIVKTIIATRNKYQHLVGSSSNTLDSIKLIVAPPCASTPGSLMLVFLDRLSNSIDSATQPRMQS
ncbi:uncharacterized protein UHOD_12206 [Ustilago sp. UG-2017b]|nr:uncharacterized protein UHOD_12206 [Ustilago sp. UG-2017b]